MNLENRFAGALELLASIRGDAQELEQKYDKLIGNLVVIAGELGVKADFMTVIERIRDLKETERKYRPTDKELEMREAMITRMLGATSPAIEVLPVPENEYRADDIEA